MCFSLPYCIAEFLCLFCCAVKIVINCVHCYELFDGSARCCQFSGPLQQSRQVFRDFNSWVFLANCNMKLSEVFLYIKSALEFGFDPSLLLAGNGAHEKRSSLLAKPLVRTWRIALIALKAEVLTWVNVNNRFFTNLLREKFTVRRWSPRELPDDELDHHVKKRP